MKLNLTETLALLAVGALVVTLGHQASAGTSPTSLLLPLSSPLLGGVLWWWLRGDRVVAGHVALALVGEGLILALAGALAWDMLRAVAVGTGWVLMVLGNGLPRTRPNVLFGFRSRWALLSERAWYASQRRAGAALLATGALLTVLSATLPTRLLVPWLLPVGFLMLLLPVSWSLWQASQKDYESERQPRPALAEARATLPPLTSLERTIAALMWWITGLSAVALVGIIALAPPQIPMHYNETGEVDRYGSPRELISMLVFLPAMTAFLWWAAQQQTVSVGQRQAALAISLMSTALLCALLVGFPLGSVLGWPMAAALAWGPAAAVMALGLTCLLPAPDGRRRRAGGGCLLLLGLLLASAGWLPGKAGAGLAMALNMLIGPVFLVPFVLYGVPIPVSGLPKS